MEDIILIYTVTLDPSESVVGKGINISLILKKLGIDSIATGIVNHKNVEQVAEELDKAEIENQFIEQTRGIKITAKNQQKLLDSLARYQVRFHKAHPLPRQLLFDQQL